MKGTMLTIPVDGPIQRENLTAPPDLEALQTAVGGYLEKVPQFSTLDDNGKTIPCVALCNEEGKLARPIPLRFNPRAQRMWSVAFKRATGVGPHPDYLVGTVVVLYGDSEFMEAL